MKIEDSIKYNRIIRSFLFFSKNIKTTKKLNKKTIYVKIS